MPLYMDVHTLDGGVTMDDVAKTANVSVTTVSHVLNGTRKVHPETEKLVRAAIQVFPGNDLVARLGDVEDRVRDRRRS